MLLIILGAVLLIGWYNCIMVSTMLHNITPVILTYNEEANIGRVLDRLTWAQSIVVVDSFSTDRTAEIAAQYPAVHFFQRKFDSHAVQWNYAIICTGITTEWILALDADYILTHELISELKQLRPDSSAAGYRTYFRYCIFGRPLRSSLYPPVTVLFRTGISRYIQDGHTQRVVIQGETRSLCSLILHDDRKPLSSWLQAQDRYMCLEAELIHTAAWSLLSLQDKIRKMIFFAPLLTFFYCFFFKQGIADGWSGMYYALQRTLAELILSLRLIQQRVDRTDKP